MAEDSIVSLEEEVVEFLLSWGSQEVADKDGRIVDFSVDTTDGPHEDALPNAPRQIFIGETSTDPSTVRDFNDPTPDAPASEKVLREARMERGTSSRSHPYCRRKRSVGVASTDAIDKTSYMAELKKRWPSRYLKLKASLRADREYS